MDEELDEFIEEEVEVNDRPRAMKKPSPADFFQTTYDWLKTIGKVGTSLLFFAILSILAFSFGNKLIGILGLFYFLSVIIRIPDTYSDVFYFESIATLGFILTFITTPYIAIFFTITAEWLTKFISPFGPIEDYQETLSETVAVSAAILLLSFLIPFTGNMLMHMLYFHGIRFAIFYVIIAITSPSVFLHDLFQGITIVPLSIIQSYVIILLLGTWVFGMFGVVDFALPSITTLFQQF